MKHPEEKPKLDRVFDLLPYISKKYQDRPVFGSRHEEKWAGVSVNEYLLSSNKVSFALLASGICKGDKVVTISRNRPELNIVDMGILQIGAVHVPLYPGLPDHKLRKILAETECKVVFLSGSNLVNKILSVKNEFPAIRMIVSFDPADEAITFLQFLEMGSPAADPALLESVRASVAGTDPATIIYISGATTPVKGVILTHRNLVSNILNYAGLPHFKEISGSISFLPLAHSFERIINYCQQYFGLTVWYNERIPDMLKDFRELKPEMAVMVPLLVERLFKSLIAQSTQEGGGKTLNAMAIEKVRNLHPGSVPGIMTSLMLWYARITVFRRWKKILGGRLKFILCGGAALNHEYLNLAFAMGVPIYEGYGITEAGPLVSYNTGKKFSAYSVGKAMPGVRVELAPDGEVLVRSEGVMSGYFKQPEAYPRVIDEEGWLHTGDIGELDKNGFLTLTGIKKDLFKLSSGIYVNPEVIEERLLESPWIEGAWIYGHNKPYLSAILVPGEGITPGAWPEERKENEIREVVRIYNSGNKGPDQIIRFILAKDRWTIENGLLKDDGRLNRQRLFHFYESKLENLYKKQ